jgi:hypothetical protein
MRPATLRRYTLEAGFGAVDVLPTEHDVFRFYRLRSRRRPGAAPTGPHREHAAPVTLH